MDATDALRGIETALRLSIYKVLGDGWLTASGAPDCARLEEKREAEAKRRDGAVTSDELIEYTETYHLTQIVLRNWESFQPVFKDKKRTEVHFGIVEDVRNTIAHSRDLMIFERDLVSGIAGQLRAQVSRYRNDLDGSTVYYPLIEKVRDSLGNSGLTTSEHGYDKPIARVDVGEEMTFTGSAFSADGNPVIWKIQKTNSRHVSTAQTEVARGDGVEFSYRFTEADVNEHLHFGVAIATPSKYHRLGSTDDIRYFHYQVNPPRPSTPNIGQRPDNNKVPGRSRLFRPGSR
ncbi:hypothetical protein [Arthrobacter sp. MA-N2]|uniref:hypothetical protein n=1 Tax=Arthrobacter sp. MA-N2 TaxID=1101188 RepID=UPI000482F684|nr:hypothetical protein [Arthrobacter sp. MA-N2]